MMKKFLEDNLYKTNQAGPLQAMNAIKKGNAISFRTASMKIFVIF